MPICMRCAYMALAGEPMKDACDAKIADNKNLSCTTCWLQEDEHTCFVLDDAAEKFFHESMERKRQFPNRRAGHDLALFYNLARSHVKRITQEMKTSPEAFANKDHNAGYHKLVDFLKPIVDGIRRSEELSKSDTIEGFYEDEDDWVFVDRKDVKDFQKK